jgi:hypothetical protein
MMKQESESQPAPGGFQTGFTSLAPSTTSATCRVYRGGFVQVDFKPGLYLEEFSMDAWVDLQWGAGIAGPTSPDHNGFSIFVDKANRWQVIMGDQRNEWIKNGPLATQGKHHIAITVEKAAMQKQVKVYLNGVLGGTALVTDTVSPPNATPLLIGVGNESTQLMGTPRYRYPILSAIQEVVLYKVVLSKEEIENHSKLK